MAVLAATVEQVDPKPLAVQAEVVVLAVSPEAAEMVDRVEYYLFRQTLHLL
jgi:hypothetical protein